MPKHKPAPRALPAPPTGMAGPMGTSTSSKPVRADSHVFPLFRTVTKIRPLSSVDVP